MMNFSLILTESHFFEDHAILGGRFRYTGDRYRAHSYSVRVHPRRSSSAPLNRPLIAPLHDPQKPQEVQTRLCRV